MLFVHILNDIKQYASEFIALQVLSWLV